jgi:hypothetical protein
MEEEKGEQLDSSLALTSAVVDGDEQRVQELILGTHPPPPPLLLLLLVLHDAVRTLV